MGSSTIFFRLTGICGLLVGLLMAGSAQQAAKTPPSTPEALAFFEKNIRPVLVEKCLSCHGEKSQSASLRLDSRAGFLKGSDKGAIVDPAQPESGHLLEALRYTGPVKMPPTGKLSAEVVANFAAWIKMGAPWTPSATPQAKSMAERVADARSRLWSLQPVRKPVLPKVKNTTWSRSPLDRIVLAKLEAKGLQPAPPASRLALLRRATVDLIGLAPTPQESDAFLSDKSPNAFEKVVDRLLASPLYGERWGRHWLDVARYSDTLGYLVGNVGDPGRMYPYAYTYRDYVVRALNGDKPYDQFIREQLAADLIPLKDPRDQAALGFLTVGNRYLGNGQEIIDDRIDVVTRGLQAMTVGCARCHDHKFDPIPAADYYSLYGVFNSIHEPEVLPQIGEPADHKAYETFLAKFTPLEQKQAQLLKDKKNDEANKVREQMTLLVLHDPGAPPRAMIVQDNTTPDEPHILLRGNPGTPGPAVKRQYLQAVLGDTRLPFTKGSGRLELADLIAAPTNPLTARVFVNRVWMHHFGKPLVNTPSDFGTRGEPPVQPQLLDYLAASFMENGWSIKRLHRQIMLSSVYQQSCDPVPLTAKRDPENRLLGRMNRQRLDFEPLRDTLLELSGNLDTTVGGRPVQALLGPNRRRTLYAFVDRQDLPGLLRTFDFADPGAHAPQRNVTTVPQQSLFLMNSPFVLQQVRSLLARPEIASKSAPSDRIRALFRQIYGRAPAPQELARSLSFVSGWQSRPAVDTTPLTAWQNGYGEIDPATHAVKSFTRLPHFTGNAWQGGAQLPDPKLGWVTLRADGGHPGDGQHAVIRRWTAPYAMVVTIQGRLNHPAEAGDGVEAMILSSRGGLLGSWTARHSGVDVTLKGLQVTRGETLDFVVSSRADTNSDSFSWAPTVEANGAQAGATRWDAAADFSGPVSAEPRQPLTAWEVYTQALFLTNEFLFID
jgi:hypothetical protein